MSLTNMITKKVVTIGVGESLYDAAKLMREYHVGNVVVVDQKKGRRVPIGIITDRDIVVSAVAFDLLPDRILVEDVMGTDLVTAKSSDSFYHVLNLMKENGIKRVPVVNDEGELEGILTADDLVSVLAKELAVIAKIVDVQKKVETNRRVKLV